MACNSRLSKYTMFKPKAAAVFSFKKRYRIKEDTDSFKALKQPLKIAIRAWVGAVRRSILITKTKCEFMKFFWYFTWFFYLENIFKVFSI